MRSDQFRSMAVALGIAARGFGPEEVETALGPALRQAGRSFLWVVDDLASGRAGHRHLRCRGWAG